MKELRARFASTNTTGRFELRTGSTSGTIIATMPSVNTGGTSTYKEYTVPVTETTGTHDIYIVFKGSTAIMNLDRIELLGESIPIAVTAVNITPNDPTVYKSQTLRLTADITPNDASNKNVTWTSSDTDVATVTANGDVTGIEEGTATITVTTEDGSFTDQVTVTITESGAGTFYATRLSGSPTEKYGLAKSLSVMPGDVVSMEVYAKYIDIDGQNWTPLLNNLILSLSIPSGGIFIDGGQPGSLGNETLPFTPLDNDSEAGDAPKAYLNYIIVGRDFTPIDMGAQAVSTAAREYGQNGEHERLFFDDIVVREAGYMYIYISNEGENLVDVFFDDLKVTHTKSPVIQTNDYYPFGLTFNSYQRESSVANRFLYNGIELESSLGLDWYHAKFRTRDATTGRWQQIDPEVGSFESLTPYVANQNNPIKNADPLGNCDWCINFARKAVNYVSQKAKEVVTNTARAVVKNVKEEISEIDVSLYAKGEAKISTGPRVAFTTHKNTGVDINAGSETNIRVGGEINTTDGVKMDGFVPLNGKTEKTTGFSVGGPVAVTPGGIPLSANTSYTSTTVTENGVEISNTSENSTSVAVTNGNVGVFVTAGEETNSSGTTNYITVSPYTGGVSFGLWKSVDLSYSLGLKISTQNE